MINVRKLALDALTKILDKKSYSNIVINEFLNKYTLGDEDRRLFTNLVYGTLQHLLTIKYYLEPYINEKKTKDWVKYLLYISVYQIVYLDIPAYAIVNEEVNIAKTIDRYSSNFVNGVLRNFLRNDRRDVEEIKNDEVKYLSVKYSIPEWLICYLLKDYDYKTIVKILEEDSNVKKDAIRVNTLKIDIDSLKKELDKIGITYTEASLVKDSLILDKPIMNTYLFKKGLVTIQDESSQLVSIISSPKENSNVLDLCAAPGSKTAHLSALMKNTGKIFACDIHEHKLKLMEKSFRRLGVTNVLLQLVDARIVKKYVKKESFDLVLADVPCSGLGVIGHKIDLRYQITLEAIQSIIALQKEILDSTWELVKVGGNYVYSTCTINKEENELMIREFIKNHPNFKIVKEVVILPFEYHTDGFYICKLERVS